jgi:hypothetical protein
MRSRRASALRFQMRGVKLEISFGGTVRVVNQHQMRIRFQADGLLGHRVGILDDEARPKNFDDEVHEGHIAQNVPIHASQQQETTPLKTSWYCAKD